MDESLESRIAELEADNRRLRRQLDLRDAPAELRHRLNNTLALLRVIIRKSAAGKQDLETYVAHLEDRLAALARAQAAIDSWGAIDLHGLVVDELFQYGIAEGKRLTLGGPVIHLKPRAGQLFALAVHELAVNAVQHGALGVGVGRLDLSWSLVQEGDAVPALRFAWNERGAGTVAASTTKGFGADVILEALRYELKAVTELQFGQDGLICVIRIPFGGGVGNVGT